MQLKKALESYLEDCAIGLRPLTNRIYTLNLTDLVDHLHRHKIRRLDRLRADHLRRYFADLAHPRRGRTPAANTLHQRYRTARTWLNWCVARGWLPSNPILQVRAPVLPKPVARHLNRADIDYLIGLTAGTTRPERDRALVLLFLDTGIRRQELASLEVGDVDLGEHQVTVRVGKGGRGRVLPISTAAAHALAAWLVARPAGTLRLFGLNSVGVYQMILRLKKRAGLEKLSPHMLRHTFATYYEGDVYDLAKILGHSDITVTAEVYVHREAARLARLHDQRSPVAHVQG